MKKSLRRLCLFIVLLSGISACTTLEDDPIPAEMELLTPEEMNGIAGEEITDSVQVIVKDQFGNLMQDVSLKCTVNQGGTSDISPITDANGKASFAWRLGPSEKQSVTIKVLEYYGQRVSAPPITVNATAELPSLKDIDGNQYKIVRINDQIWMAENLRTTKYNDGTPLRQVTQNQEWANLSNTDRAFCFYNNNPNEQSGLLYTWAAVSNGQTYNKSAPTYIEGISPEGWHIPTYDEFYKLCEALGGMNIAGGELKITGAGNWQSPNTGATNSCGFSAIPAGCRNTNGTFNKKGMITEFWCVSETSGPTTPSTFWLSYDASAIFYSGGTDNKAGYSVRCVMNYE